MYADWRTSCLANRKEGDFRIRREGSLLALNVGLASTDVLAVGNLAISEGEEANDTTAIVSGAESGEAVVIAKLAAPARLDGRVHAAVRRTAVGASSALAVAGSRDEAAVGGITEVVVNSELPGAAGVVTSTVAAGVADGPVGVIALDDGTGDGGSHDGGGGEGLEEHLEEDEEEVVGGVCGEEDVSDDEEDDEI